MNANPSASGPGLSLAVENALAALVAGARGALQEDLRSVILFGSGAEGRLRATSDLNVLFVLRRFDRARVDLLREPLRLAHVAQRVAGMFLLEAELPAAAEAFAVKFADMKRRHRVLWGEPALDAVDVSAAAKRRQVQQMLLNLLLRLRERYAMLSLREEQLPLVLAEAAGPLRAAVAVLVELEGRPAATPRAALAQLAGEVLGGEAEGVLAAVGAARETRTLPAGEAGPALLRIISLVETLRNRASTEA